MLNDVLMELVTKQLTSPEEACAKATDKAGFEALLKRAGTAAQPSLRRMNSMALVGVLCLALLSFAAPAKAQDEAQQDAQLMKDGTLVAFLLDVPLFVIGEVPRGPRPAALPVLYVSFIGLEVYDGYSTSTGVARGAAESNPLLRAAVEKPIALWAVKSVAAVASIYMAERLWKRHRRGQAIAVMVTSNVLMAAVAASNLSVVRAQR